jgi:hypothetical protein
LKTSGNILAGLLALFVLTTSISHSLSFHICGGEIQSLAVFGRAQSCQDQDNACERTEKPNHTSFNHKGCCEDTTVLIDSDKYKATEKITLQSSQFICLPEVSLVVEVGSSESQLSDFSLYKPPLIERDITILVQTFLI